MIKLVEFVIMKKQSQKNKKMEIIKRRPKSEYKTVICSKCNRMLMKIESTSISGICWLCVTRMVEPPKFVSDKSTGRPRGWQWMKEFVDKDGNVYHKGEEIPELKGTKTPFTTTIKKSTTKRITKKEKERIKIEAAAKVFDLKKELENTKLKTKQKKIESEINKLQRIIK